MLPDSLCRRCPVRKAMLDARDQYYQAAFKYGKMCDVLEQTQMEAEAQLDAAEKAHARSTRNIDTMNTLIADLKAEMEPPKKKPWWKFW